MVTERVAGEMESAAQVYEKKPARASEGVGDGHQSEGLVGSRVQNFVSDVPRPPRQGHLNLKQEAVTRILKEHKDFISDRNGRGSRV